MHACEPRARHRGFFLHSPDAEGPETGELENPEGFVVRVRTKPSARRHVAANGRSRMAPMENVNAGANPEIRSGSVTGSRQRAHLPR
jgi:hypothetical protein